MALPSRPREPQPKESSQLDQGWSLPTEEDAPHYYRKLPGMTPEVRQKWEEGLRSARESTPEATKTETRQLRRATARRCNELIRFCDEHLPASLGPSPYHRQKADQQPGNASTAISVSRSFAYTLEARLGSLRHGYSLGKWSPENIRKGVPTPEKIVGFLLRLGMTAEIGEEHSRFEFENLTPAYRQLHFGYAGGALTGKLPSIANLLSRALEDLERYKKYQKKQRGKREHQERSVKIRQVEDQIEQDLI